MEWRAVNTIKDTCCRNAGLGQLPLHRSSRMKPLSCPVLVQADDRDLAYFMGHKQPRHCPLQELLCMLQAEDKEFMEWEDKMAIKRSQGHFFQSLYRIKRQLPDGGKFNSPPVQVGLTQWAGT